jgi:hypothetical protein
MKRVLYGLAALLALAGPALAQGGPTFPTGIGNTRAPLVLQGCLDRRGLAVPCSFSDTVADVLHRYTVAGREHRAEVVALSPLSGAPRQYSSDAAPITGNSTGTTGSVVGTLSGATGRLTYICGFNVSAIGGTAAVGPITIAGLIGSSMVYQMASTASGNLIGQTFTPCIPASAVNTPITITTTANGTATGVDVNSWGFQQ